MLATLSYLFRSVSGDCPCRFGPSQKKSDRVHNLGELCSVAHTREHNLVETSSLIRSKALSHLLRPTTRRVTPYDVVGDKGFCKRPIVGHHCLVQGRLIQ